MYQQVLYRGLCALTLLAGLLAGGCKPRDASGQSSADPAGETSAVIAVDAAHRMTESGHPATPYLAASGERVVVRANNYPFIDPRAQARVPNVVRVLYDRSEYAADWNGAGCTLDASTLRLMKGSAFKRFEPGKQAFVGVGVESIDPRTGKLSFQEFWVASVLFH